MTGAKPTSEWPRRQNRGLVVGRGAWPNRVARGLGRADQGFNVVGVDLDPDHIHALAAGAAPFEEPGLGALLERHVGQRFRPMAWSETTEADLSDVEWVVLTVGVHDLPFPEPANLATLHGVVAALIEREALRGRTMILRTTLPVGTTHAIASHIEERHGLIEGEDYHLAFVPERLVEGQAIEEERRLPKIVGPMSHGALVAAEALFSKIGGRVIPVAGPKEAEFVKLIDNAWRHTRFAFANDAAVAASAMGVDVIDVIEAANADYDRNAVARPGPVSGYCLGKDPIIFEYAMQEVPERSDLQSVWMTALRSSQRLVEWTVNRTIGSKVLVAGLTFKENIDDMRMAFSEPLIQRLLEEGHEVSICDPHLGMNAYTQVWPSVEGKVERSGTDLGTMLHQERYDTVILAVRHEAFENMHEVLSTQGRVLDLWNLYRGLSNQYGLGTSGGRHERPDHRRRRLPRFTPRRCLSRSRVAGHRSGQPVPWATRAHARAPSLPIRDPRPLHGCGGHRGPDQGDAPQPDPALWGHQWHGVLLRATLVGARYQRQFHGPVAQGDRSQRPCS